MITRIVPEGEDAVFHVVSRMAFQMLNLGKKEKQVFRDLLAKQAIFCGVEVLSYCLLDNHFHILVRVPYQQKLSDEILVKRYTALYQDSDNPHAMEPDALKALLKEGSEIAEEKRKQLITRMGSISIFMKELKQRFGIWYNREHGNKGTLWAKRFDSVLVENVQKTLQLIGAYIDLNPIRLNACKAPQDYPFSTFGEAVQGNATAQQWLCQATGKKRWAHAYKQYQTALDKSNQSMQTATAILSLKGIQTGVIGSHEYVRKWSRYKENKQPNKKETTSSLLLKGICHVGMCALTVGYTFRSYPKI